MGALGALVAYLTVAVTWGLIILAAALAVSLVRR